METPSPLTGSRVAPRRLPRLGWPGRLACVALLTLLVTTASSAQPAPGDGDDTHRVTLGRASVALRSDWTSTPPLNHQIQSMPVTLRSFRSPDDRITIHGLIIDPFGIDLQGWGLADLMAPTLAELLEQAGAPTSALGRSYTFACAIGDAEGIGRIVNIPLDEGLVSGVACGRSTIDRWVVFYVLVRTPYERPTALKLRLEEAHAILRSFRFD